MHKILGLLLLCSVQAFSQEVSFESANAAYETGNYTEAIVQYQELVDQSFQSKNLFYNLGNAYFKNNELALSILYLEKAQKLAPGDDNIQHNLRLAYLNTSDKIEPLPELFFILWWKRFLSSKTASQWAKLGLLFSFIAFISFAIIRIRKNWLLKVLASFSVVCFLAFTSLAFLKNSYDKSHEYAIVMQDDVQLLSAPNSSGKELFRVNQGLKVRRIESIDTWTKLRLEDGNEAWVKSEAIASI
ncbi:MAG: tetratricopeptide repeat protein [Chitinophagales bacterium]